MPNAFAYLMLVSWPLASILLFRRLPVGRALIASLLLAYLFLPPPPAGFDFPLLPPLTKETIPSLVIVLVCLVMYRGQMTLLPDGLIGKILVAVFILSPLFTVLTNFEPVFWGHIGLPALRLREAVALMIQQGLVIAPLLLARNFLRQESDHRDMLMALFAGGMIYSLFMLIEIRLSPQINVWVYGYFQHLFEQMIRFGGFRPIVFLYHGLWVAFFALTAVLAAVALARAAHGPRLVGFGMAAVYLLVVLVLCKSVASILYALALLPMVALFGQRLQLHVAVVLAFLALGYPLLKGADLVPQETMLHMAEQIDTDRANSLRFRFDQETILLERAAEKPLFGWGTWGRNHIMDPNTGQFLTVTDGRWIIVIGVLGWVGFLAEVGLLTLPIFLIWAKTRDADPKSLSPWIGPMALILVINVIDLIPNATITPLTWLFAGAVLGYAETVVVQRRRQMLAPLRTIL